MPVSFPITEATSALTFGALTTHVAMKLGVAYYGTSGTSAPSSPIDTRNLGICQTIVNDAIRMFISDAPAAAGGWQWTKPIAQVDLWPQIGPSYANSAGTLVGSTYVSSTSYNSANSTINLQLTTPANPPPTISIPSLYVPNFVNSMEQRQIWLGGVPSPAAQGWYVSTSNTLIPSTIGIPYSIVNYDGPTSIDIFVGSTTSLSTSLSTWANQIPFSFACTGDYTLPADFGGEIAGEVSFIQQTNRGMILSWTDETIIRARRQNYNIESGTPFWCAVRIMPTPSYDLYAPPYNNSDGSGFPSYRRRWEVMSWPISNEFLSILIPYQLAFNNLVNTTDLPPSPISFDDALLAACRAQAERYMTDSLGGPDWQYYRQFALPNAHKINGRSVNKMIGYNGAGMRRGWNGGDLSWWRGFGYQRPVVPVNPIGANSF